MKNINLMVNDYCNNKCQMCNIWQNATPTDLSVDRVQKLFAHETFRHLEEVSITGGEPFMHRNLLGVADVILSSLPLLKKLFINSNGMYPGKLVSFCHFCVSRVQELTLCFSLEGPRGVNRIIRGVDTYPLVLQSLGVIQRFREHSPKVRAKISSTLQPGNSSVEVVKHLLDLADEYDADFTFRFVHKSTLYYQNENSADSLDISREEKLKILDYVVQRKGPDQFIDVLRDYIQTGFCAPLQTPEKELICKAGELFSFIQANGEILPCLFSTRVIGNIEEGITNPVQGDLGKYESCPCCSECHVFPMLTYLPQVVR